MNMDMFLVGMFGIGIVCLLTVLVVRQNAEAIHRLREEQRKSAAAIRSLENQAAYTPVQKSRDNSVDAQAARLFQEQLYMKLGAMDASKAMLREAMKHRND